MGAGNDVGSILKRGRNRPLILFQEDFSHPLTHLDAHGIIIVQRTYILYSNRSATNRYAWGAKNVEWEKGEDTMTYTASDIAKYHRILLLWEKKACQ